MYFYIDLSGQAAANQIVVTVSLQNVTTPFTLAAGYNHLPSETEFDYGTNGVEPLVLTIQVHNIYT